MAEAIRIGTPPIEIRLRRHASARRMVLRVGRVAQEPVLTLPPGASLSRARAFALDHEPWLRVQLAARPKRALVANGTEIPYRGVTLRIASGAKTGLRDGALYLAGPEARLPARAGAFLREMARARCVAASELYAARLGKRFGRVTMRDPAGRWGSCSARGDLMYSWRLILAPDDVLDYVAAHEVAHLAELNHGPGFWAVLARLRPDYAAQRDWLRKNGAGLHLWDFRAG